MGRLCAQIAWVCRCLLVINNDLEQYKGDESASLLALNSILLVFYSFVTPVFSAQSSPIFDPKYLTTHW